MFIRKLNLSSDISLVLKDLETILTQTSWEETNQVGLTHRQNASDPWLDSVGSLHYDYEPETRPKESDFCVWNPLTPEYVTEQIRRLCEIEKCKVGRVRFMRLHSKRGLSVHSDSETRFHLALKTNSKAYFGQTIHPKKGTSDLPIRSISYHIPADGNWYEVDTTKEHFVYNGGTEERIHLVVCKAS